MSSSDLPEFLLGYETPTDTTPKSTHTARVMSTRSSLNSRRTNSYGARDTIRRNLSHTTKRPVTDADAYTYALRAAYLAYLLQPRQKRVQHVANTSKPIQRSTTSINDMVKDFSLTRDSKSTRFPHGFMAELDKRIANVLVGKEKGIEYNDALVKRTFANFLNEFRNPTFRKTMEKDRRVEDLLLIFYSRATSELQKGKSAEDDSWKLMVDRHVALFVRLISSTLHNNDWMRERPELSSRLKTLETKLLQHDQDLADQTQRNGGQGGQSIEVEVPRSYEVRDMPLVIRVCSIFAKPTIQAQNDINAHKEQWTERAALRDLKEYQNHMMLNTRATICKDDFELDEAFEMWRKAEISDISQMMLAIVQSNPELAKHKSDGVPMFKAPSALSSDSDLSRQMSGGAEVDSSSMLDHQLEMLNLGDSSPRDSGTGSMDATQANFTYIPPDARIYYRQLLKVALAHDLSDSEPAPVTVDDVPPVKLLSRQSHELLNEVAVRWRIPLFTRIVLFLDVVRENFQHQVINLDTLDAAFLWAKEPQPEPRKNPSKSPALNQSTQLPLLDRHKWTVPDHNLFRTILANLHDALLRELFETFQHCYEPKPPTIGVIMYVLDTHIYSDPFFTQNPEDLDAFTAMMADALRTKARDKYHELLSKHVSDDASNWQFYDVMQLGKAVTALCEKIQKRYRKNPEIMGVNPLQILVEESLPSFAEDAKELIKRIMHFSKEKGQEVDIQDGFELYKDLVEIRKVYAQALPGREFTFHIEGLLQDFVWRWIASTDANINQWVEGAVAQDQFQIRQDPQAKEAGELPTDDERHSHSAIDIFLAFNQAIDQIVKLGWDDDLQYAKFMTAISKSIGKGVARYCELLELKFAKEMDRQTPEQEMRAQQTQREKWYAAARDVWTTGGKGGEKIEPFQFWPESFVKINDVEYATLQLDRVEKEINVDACAEVINRLDPPPPPNVRDGKKFMFTIKIIEAEDLKAGDVTGLSDPYVVLGDEYQKRLAKTRTVYQSLSPRWDETVDILTTGPLNLIATVWDWDMVGDHDCLGRTSLKLDPAHFNDYLPREYWLDLDTQGRVLVRVSMEGERDDIQFYFGKAFRTLKRTERDMARKVTDKLSAYIQQCLSRRTLKALLGQGTLGGVNLSSAKGYFNKLSSQVAGRPMSVASPQPTTIAPSLEDVRTALKPLLDYFYANFAIMKETLTSTALIMIMTRLWKTVLGTLESLLVPPLSDKLSAQKPLSQQEVDIVYRWLQILFDFFHAYEKEDKTAHGVPVDVLRNAKYHDLQSLSFFYFDSSDSLMRTSDAIAQATARRQQETATKLNRLSAPVNLLGAPGSRQTKSIMMSRNLGTIKQAKAAKRAEAQADASDDMILRILRMRPEAEKYLRDRSRQKERLAASAAAEAIVRQSLMASKRAALDRSSAGAEAGGLGRKWATIRE
ncbi:hypothetical protein BAUCODRAFT_30998 [Baudoinia panamericana UAMH 10762]|uniref:C2 domain-containing protein n=1 Tax=Baudoinia panamericana (strain UAMH 10762) TaxID=717646 RepID=M2N406_BAUPA|nr:uncharacterized protein BAUCODRAFT_30998 [Baudoinia panamericana UAMH 10762]EMC98718.1 hypothetical protein BAUCODRAFT_30998 [Baudoinia panamericana UAMH 10762]